MIDKYEIGDYVEFELPFHQTDKPLYGKIIDLNSYLDTTHQGKLVYNESIVCTIVEKHNDSLVGQTVKLRPDDVIRHISSDILNNKIKISVDEMTQI